MGKTVNYQCNLGISKVIETLDEDENIVEGLSQEAGNPHILSQDPSWADLLSYAKEMGCYTGCPYDQETDDDLDDVLEIKGS